MAVSKKLTLGLTSLAFVTAVAVGGSSLVMAQGGDNHDSLVDRIASKFNVSKDDVQAVFDEERDARQAERAAEVSSDLQKAVDAGKLTAEQKTMIENKMKENQSAREAEMTSLREWASANNIDMRYIMGGGRHGANLDRAVADGKITAEQKTLIEQKQAEVEKARDAKRDAMEQWANDNNIDDAYLHMGMEKGGRGEHRGGSRL